MIYFSSVESQWRYGVLAWGNASDYKPRPVEKLQSHILEHVIKRKQISKKQMYEKVGAMPLKALQQYRQVIKCGGDDKLLREIPRVGLARNNRV